MFKIELTIFVMRRSAKDVKKNAKITKYLHNYVYS